MRRLVHVLLTLGAAQSYTCPSHGSKRAGARKVYAQAKLAEGYPVWPYREVLDRRMAQADENVARFRAPAKQGGHGQHGEPGEHDKERRMMIETAFACTGCHQQ